MKARWLTGLAVVTACSWARYAMTGSLRIDENYPNERAGTCLFIVLVLGWALLVSAWVKLIKEPPENPRRLAYAGLAIVSLMVPLLSNDIYGLFAYSGLAIRGHDVYASTQALPSSYWFTWIGERWRTNLFAYGPLALISGAWPSVAGENHPLLAIFLLRLTWLPFVIGAMELSFRYFRERPFFQAMVWLNPLVLVQGPGQLHLDVLGLVAVTAGLIAQSNGKRAWGAVGWAFATLSKWNLTISAPWFWLAGARTTMQRVRSAALMVFVLGVGAVAVYLPVWRGPETITAPIHALRAQTLVPGGSIVDVIGGLGDAFQNTRSTKSGVLDAELPVVERVARAQKVRARIWRITQWFMLALAAVAAWPLLRMDDIALATGTFIVIALTLASPKFQSWYLMSALPFFGLTCPPAWRRWWPWAIFFSVTEEFPLALPRSAFILAPAVATSVGMTAVIFLWSFRKRYLSPT